MKKNHVLHNNRRLLVSSLLGGLTLCLATLGGGLAIRSSFMDHTNCASADSSELKTDYQRFSFLAETDSNPNGNMSLVFDLKTNYRYVDEGVYLLSFDYRYSICINSPQFSYIDTDIEQKDYVTGNTPVNVTTSFTITDYQNVSYEMVCFSTGQASGFYISLYGNTIFPFENDTTHPLELYGDVIIDFKIATTEYLTYTNYMRGWNDGEDYGYVEGYTDGNNQSLEADGFSILLESILNAPVSMFRGMFDFEIFGINVRSIVSVILTIGLVILAISIFKGKE